MHCLVIANFSICPLLQVSLCSLIPVPSLLMVMHCPDVDYIVQPSCNVGNINILFFLLKHISWESPCHHVYVYRQLTTKILPIRFIVLYVSIAKSIQEPINVGLRGRGALGACAPPPPLLTGINLTTICFVMNTCSYSYLVVTLILFL